MFHARTGSLTGVATVTKGGRVFVNGRCDADNQPTRFANPEESRLNNGFPFIATFNGSPLINHTICRWYFCHQLAHLYISSICRGDTAAGRATFIRMTPHPPMNSWVNVTLIITAADYEQHQTGPLITEGLSNLNLFKMRFNSRPPSVSDTVIYSVSTHHQGFMNEATEKEPPHS